MLRIEWVNQKAVLWTALNVMGTNLAMAWKIPDSADVGRWLSTHRYGDSDTAVPVGSAEFPDDNKIEWGPSVYPDNWCHHEALFGELTYSVKRDQYRDSLEKDEYGYYVNLPNKTYLFDGDITFRAPWGPITRISGSIEGGHIERWEGNQVGDTPRWTGKYDISYDFQTGGYRRYGTYYNLYWGWSQDFSDWVSYADNQWTTSSLSSIVQPWMYRDRYYALSAYVKRTFESVCSKMRRVGNDNWHAALAATDGFQPYDINMVESIFGFSGEDILPKGTSSTVLDIVNRAVKSKGGFASPKGIVSAAQIFANCYLYYKYVASGNYSDFMQLAIGDDKKFIVDAVKDIYTADPNYVPTSENWRLKFIAERIVHRGSKCVTTYGAVNDDHSTILGPMHSHTSARLKASPRYLDDMSSASYVCEQFGLSLTAERLVQVIPYEFVAEWFLPIEETIHSIENNADVLNMRYKVHNLCLSRKDTIELDMNFLLAMFGLSGANGQLHYKCYDRHSQMEFPPTVLDLTLHPSMSLSRWMQGSSLILTHLR